MTGPCPTHCPPTTPGRGSRGLAGAVLMLMTFVIAAVLSLGPTIRWVFLALLTAATAALIGRIVRDIVRYERASNRGHGGPPALPPARVTVRVVDADPVRVRRSTPAEIEAGRAWAGERR